MNKTVCMVCTGNTCRSPMAEALLRKMLDEAGIKNIDVFSAGTFAIEGQPASEQSQIVMKDYGISLKKHRAAPLTRELCEKADVIITMEAWHIDEVLARNARNKEKTHTLKGYAAGILGFPGEGYDISDPFRGTIDDYKACAKEIHELVTLAAPLLCRDLE
ncbi:MAG: low molecular weight protein arginine phosphatase [Bacillota bacterium]